METEMGLRDKGRTTDDHLYVGSRLRKEVLRRWSGPSGLGSDTGDPIKVKGTI